MPMAAARAGARPARSSVEGLRARHRISLQPVQSVDESGEADPSQPVLLAVLEATDHRLVDAAIGLERSLAPAKRSTLPPDGRPDEIEAALFLGLAGDVVPGHDRTLAANAHLRLTRRLSPSVDGAIGITEVTACAAVEIRHQRRHPPNVGATVAAGRDDGPRGGPAGPE